MTYFSYIFLFLFLSCFTCSTDAVLCSPKPNKIVFVLLTNRSLSEVKDNSAFPFTNSVISQGALFTNMHGVCCTRSGPNYGTLRNFVRLFSGSDQNLPAGASPSPPSTPWKSPNLYTALSAASLSFAGYSEGLPSTGYSQNTPVGTAPDVFLPSHCPWSNLFFTTGFAPSSINRPFSDFTGTTFDSLPDVSFVSPNTCHDQSGACSAAEADAWLEANFKGYLTWAAAHNSLLVLFYDQDSGCAGCDDTVPLVIAGGPVLPGTVVSDAIDHFSVHRMILDFYGIAPFTPNTIKAGPFPDALWASPSPALSPSAALPAPDHVVIVIMENQNRNSFFTSSTPWTDSLRANGALFETSRGLMHPSQPNYLSLFAGDQLGCFDSSKLAPFAADVPNLASALHQQGLAFGGYCEGQPSVGYTGLDSGKYAYRHNPWMNFPAGSFPTSWNMPFTSFQALRDSNNFCSLPLISIVVPDVCNDQHDCALSVGDTWLQNEMGSYVAWAQQHNSMFILTYDEDASNCVVCGNAVLTIFTGEMVTAGTVAKQPIDHHSILRMLLDMYNLPKFRRRLELTCPFDENIWKTTTGSGVCSSATTTTTSTTKTTSKSGNTQTSSPSSTSALSSSTSASSGGSTSTAASGGTTTSKVSASTSTRTSSTHTSTRTTTTSGSISLSLSYLSLLFILFHLI